MSKLRSRKFWMAVVTGLLVVSNKGLGLGIPEDAVLSLAAVSASYIFGQGMVDASAHKPQTGSQDG